MKYEDIECLAFPLPEAIEKEKWCGRFDRARAMIKRRLDDEAELSALKKRLMLELNNLDYIESRYNISEEEAIERVRKKIPDMTSEELERMRLEDRIDWMYINGEVRYIDDFDATLYKVYPDIWQRLPEGDTGDYSDIQHVVDTARDGEEMRAYIHIRHRFRVKGVKIKDEDAGKQLLVHLPLPKERGNIHNLKILNVTPEPAGTSCDDCLQPTVFFQAAAGDGGEHIATFSVEYQLEHGIIYKDLSLSALESPQYSDSRDGTTGAPGETLPDDVRQYLIQEPPHMSFTPYLKSICDEIVGDEERPLFKARKIYDWITTKVDYRFVRDYCSIDNISEYCAVNKRGDCGVQALLFITLCRIAGVPARWQSGLAAKPGQVGQHDWAMFYIDGLGWRHADLSFGGSAYTRGAYDRWNFFFGNIDPFRIPINDGFQKSFDPPKKHWRIDPYDNQCGEAEFEDRGLRSWEVEYEYEDLGIRLMER